jgi:hypothetical protein
MTGAWFGKPDAGCKLSMCSPCNSTVSLCPHPNLHLRAASLNHPTGSGCRKRRRLCQPLVGGNHKFPILRLTRHFVSRGFPILRHNFSILRCNFPVVRRNFPILRFTTGGFHCPTGGWNGNLVEDVSKVETTQRR